ncbi:MAG: C_GCAxxG_C_C family protein [Anaerolineae bacterium]|nr:C_GCAxxG_C_C family protein [Anaerolineae bacterium]
MSEQIEQAVARSKELFASPLCCSESVLKAIAEARGVDSALIPRLATGFCGGIGRTGGPCGALTGAIMGLGLIAGRDTGEEPRGAFDATVQELIAGFEAAFGAINCLDLTGCSLLTDEGRAAFHAQNQHDRCADYVGEATRLALTLAQNNK